MVYRYSNTLYPKSKLELIRETLPRFIQGMEQNSLEFPEEKTQG